MKAFLLALLITVPAHAQLTLTGAGKNGMVTPPPSYTGPGDVVAGAKLWYGFPAYSAAVVASGTQKVFNVRRTTDNVVCDFLIATDASLGLTTATCNSSTEGGKTAAQFAGTNTTGNATSSSLTVSFTGLGGAVHAGDRIVGSGFTGSYCVSVGSFSAGSQTCTANTSQTVAVSTAVTILNGLFIAKAYDQSGNGADLPQATTADQPALLPGALGSCPAIGFGPGHLWLIGTITSVSQPYTYVGVAQRFSYLGDGSPELISAFDGSGSEFGWEANPGANLVRMYAGTNVTLAALDDHWHASQGVFNGASSVLASDGTENAANAGTGATGTHPTLGGANGGSNFMNGFIAGAGLWPSAFSSGNRTSMNSTIHAACGSF